MTVQFANQEEMIDNLEIDLRFSSFCKLYEHLLKTYKQNWSQITF